MKRLTAAAGFVALVLSAGPGLATRRQVDPDYRTFAPHTRGAPQRGAGGSVSPARPPPPPPDGTTRGGAVDVQKDLYPFLRKHCLSCHNNVTRSAKTSLTNYQDPAAVRKYRATWLDALRSLPTARCPPPTAHVRPGKSLSDSL